ncbi:hypothetical protein [uncultured Lacinutrix sp.]|uniref:hypothetical protein n=1 Tax=uncultured Lacinutrix sp. TaxID=574032 RepID=UPI0026278AA8|nr:hypothetical protein [uncultured Lacinutrix sp.]
MKSRFEIQNELISRNESAFTHFLNNIETIKDDSETVLDIFDDNIFSFAKKKNWGFYSILSCKSVFKNDTVYKTALIGKKSEKNIALYVTDYDKPLKLSGDITFLGDIKVPNSRIEQAYINGVSGNKVKIKGKQLKSQDKLPKIDKEILINLNNYSTETIKNETTVFVNSFSNKTIVINFEELKKLDKATLKGNIILTSNKSITIDNSLAINDILIVAPKVYVKKGFNGNAQIIAKTEVDIEEDVSLTYPSSIYVKNDIDSVNVSIKKNTIIAGGIVINGNTYKGSLKRSLTIAEGSKIIGNVYCYGKTQLKGTIIGSIYSDRFFLKTASSNYENTILNASINRDSLPKSFVELPLFKTNIDKANYEVLKTF